VLPLVKVAEEFLGGGWLRAVLNRLDHCLVEVVAHESDRFRRRRSRYLFAQLFSMEPLLVWVLQEEGLRLEIKYPFFSFF